MADHAHTQAAEYGRMVNEKRTTCRCETQEASEGKGWSRQPTSPAGEPCGCPPLINFWLSQLVSEHQTALIMSIQWSPDVESPLLLFGHIAPPHIGF